MNSLINKNFFSLAIVIAAAVIIFVFGYMAQTTSAHTDPVSCDSTGVSLSLTVLRADGTTPVGGGSVSAGETIKYRATLSHAGGSNCNYEGGDLDIITPDGVNHDVDGGTIPLVSSGSPFVGTLATYVVSSADVGGDADLDASAVYSGGTSHLGSNVTPVGANTPASTPFLALVPGIVTEVHNSAHEDITDTSVAFGTDVHDEITVTATSSGPTPTGTADFTLMTGLVCDGETLDSDSNVALVAGVAESGVQTDLVAGDYSYLAHYDGDTNYSAGDAACEPFTIEAEPMGHIIVDKVTNPSNATTSFSFDAVGGSYNDFSLTDAAAPNDQALVAGTYSVSETLPSGWEQTSATCVSSLGESETETIGNLELDAGETITCTFTNTMDVVEWCSPGYWRNHLDSWVGFETDDSFLASYPGYTFPPAKKNSKFTPEADPSLLDILQNPQIYGGEAFNLVGDLLSAAHPDVDFDLGDARVENCPLN
jgi:hypothetical protein